MDSATHQRFIQQLCHWAATYIAQGRSPFRKAEQGTPLSTAQGPLCPDMVLWINQDSFVAGGFIQIPDNEDDLDTPCACAESLGVNYFAIWGSKTLTIWQADNRKMIEQWPVPPLDQDSPRSYEMLLVQLMDEFRTLAVIGACPPDKLSHWHLTNLCLGTINKATPLLSEHLRRTRSDQVKTIEIAEQQAEAKLTLAIARLLVLQYLNKLPYSIEPERLDQALKEFSAALEIPQLDQLSGQHDDEPDLDEQSQVLLHHLLRRLDQIGLFRHPQRAILFINQLLRSTSASPRLPEETPGHGTLHMQHNSVSPHDADLVEIDQPQRLAFKYLLRVLNNWPHPALCRADLFNLPREITPDHIVANLSAQDVPSTHYRNAWQAHIHAAWSGRRPSCPRNTPTWCYQALYLLGIAAAQGSVHLCLPESALHLPWIEHLFALLKEEYTVKEIALSADRLTLQLERGNAPQQITVLSGTTQQTEITNGELFGDGVIAMALRLRGKDQLLRLIEMKRLLLPSADTRDNIGLKRFYKSCLSLKMSETLLGANATNKHLDHLPIPSPTILESLAALEFDGLSSGQQTALIDATLQQLLDIDDHSCQDSTPESSASEAIRIDKKSLENQIHQALDVKGVPLFPDHYLYDFYRPELRSFHTDHRPWHLVGEFMGTFTLEDDAGNRCDCTNDIIAYAALLMCQRTATPDLPTDPTICQQIVERYLNDLVHIHQFIWDECHAALPTATKANRLGNKIWKDLEFPSYKLVEEALERFNISQL